MKPTQLRDDVSIVLCGEAGQGLQTIEHALTHILKIAGYHVFSTSEFMSRIRGGANSTLIRVASNPVGAYVRRIDLLIPLTSAALTHLNKRISADTVILGEQTLIGGGEQTVAVPFAELTGPNGRLYAGTAAAGIILGLFGISRDLLDKYITQRFDGKGGDVLARNISAGSAGHAHGSLLRESKALSIDVEPSPALGGHLILSGAEAVALGAVAGGCDLVSSYPMSPSTDVLTSLAKMARDFDLVVEQAEDEIAAVNMALGAWYAGARGFVTTAGGGFALMCEGISLAGMVETPIVVHIGQRPGPATGLPTRTEQGDIELALYAGHGEFPRMIFAPGTLGELFQLTKRAFDMADTYQIPVFILTDEFLLDSYGMTPPITVDTMRINKHIVKTSVDYRRYAHTGDGISPRGVPGFGEGLVRVDSDEHTEEGLITESMDVRVSMVDKRLSKHAAMLPDVLPPTLVGESSASTLVVCWGSNYLPVAEALSRLDSRDVAMLHFAQIYPLHPSTTELLTRAKRTVIVENNATSQFGKILHLYADIKIHHRILKYDGMPFSVEELVERIGALLTH